MQTTTETGPRSVATEETDRLIASNKVEGTAVYIRQAERLGSVYNFMVDKRSGQVEYAVMSVRGIPRHRRQLPPAAVEDAEVRHCHGRLCRRP